MPRKILQAHKNLTTKLIRHSELSLNGVSQLINNGELNADWAELAINSCLDLLSAIQQYKQIGKPLFIQGQKS